MNIKKKFDSIDQSQLSDSQKGILSKIKEATKNFTITDEKSIEKVDGALDSIIAKLQKTNPQAIKGEVKEVEPKKEEPKKSTKSRTKTPKEPKKEVNGKRTIFSIAKEIRKADESWEDAKKRAKKIMEGEKEETTKKMKTETDKLLAFIKRRKELDGLSGTSIKKDSKIEAKPKGRRISKNGKRYYEYRDNRTDRLAPNFEDKIYLADGGYAGGGYVVIAKSEKGGGFVMSKPTSKAKAEKLKSLLPKIDGESNEVMTLNKASKLSGLVGKEYLKYADGGNVIDAFQMRTVRGVDSQPTEVLTNEQKVEFADGGTIIGTPETPLARGLDIDYTGLVGETGGMSAGEMFANGGGIPNNYQDRYYGDIWDIDWTQEQKNHFLQDHKNEIGFDEEFYGVSIKEKTTKKMKSSKGQEVGFTYIDSDKLLKTKSSELPKYVKFSLQKHIREGQYAMGGSLGNHGLKQGDQIIKTMSGGVQKVKTKSGDIVYVNLANGYRGAEPPLPFSKGGSLTNERRHVNKAQDYEVRYAKNKPNRAGYKGKRSFDDGGMIYKDLFEDYENQPAELSEIVSAYMEKFEEGDYDYEDSKKFLAEVESVGYTFDYGLDNEPYGLRPIGVKLSQIEGYEDMDDDGYFKKGGSIAEKSLYIPTYQVLKVHTTDGKVFENVYSDTNVITGVYVSEKPLRKKDVDDKNQLELFRKGGLPKTAIYIPRYKVDFIETEYDGDIQGNHIYGGVWIDMKKQFRLVEEAKKQGRFGNKPKFKVDDLVYNKRTKSVGIVRLEDEKGETKTDADGNVNTSELEAYNPLKNKKHKNAKVAPSTQKEIDSRGLFKPFSKFEGGGKTKRNVHIVNEGEAFDEKKYKAIYDDYDKDGTSNIDDANPLDKTKKGNVEQVELKETFTKLLKVKADLDSVMYSAIDKLDDKAPEDADIYARTKTPYSILKKLVDKRMLDPEKGLTDMVGTTIAVDNQKELEQVRDEIDGGLLGKILDRDDYYKNPKAGYRAYHYIVEYKGYPIEVQLKTKKMKKLNEVSHEFYKNGSLDAKGLEQVSKTFEMADKGDKKAIKEVDKLLKNKELLASKISTSKSKKEYAGGGSTKRGGAMQLAKQIRKDGESWQSALKRANEQMRNK